MAQHVYHWKHGWIPLTHAAALSKAKGNHDRAAALLNDAHSPEAGIHSRQHVAAALVDLPKIETPTGRADAMKQVKAAAVAHNATDLLPGRAEQQTPADRQKEIARANLQRLLAEHRAKNPGHTSKGAVKLAPANTPTPAELTESRSIYGNGKEFYIQMRGEGKSHAVAMRMAAAKYGRKP